MCSEHCEPWAARPEASSAADAELHREVQNLEEPEGPSTTAWFPDGTWGKAATPPTAPPDRDLARPPVAGTTRLSSSAPRDTGRVSRSPLFTVIHETRYVSQSVTHLEASDNELCVSFQSLQSK